MPLLTRCLVVSGHLSTSSALLIDRSAEQVESWRRSLRAPDSQRPRVAPRKHCRCRPLCRRVLLVGAHFRLISSVSSRFASVLPLSILSFSCHTALLTMPAASGYSSTATSCWQSWDGGTSSLTPPGALALQGVNQSTSTQKTLERSLAPFLPAGRCT